MHELAAIARKLGAPDGYSAAPLPGGLTNRNYRLGLPGGDDLVVRLGGPHTALLGVDRERELAALATARGLGAELVLADLEADVLVTRYIPGRTLSPAEAAADLPGLVAVLREVHALPPIPGRFHPIDAARELAERALARGLTAPADLDAALATGARIAAALGEAPAVTCHNDLLAANFLHDGARWRLIDWEYAAMGDAFFDLGNMAINMELDRAARRRMLALYFGREAEADLARLDLMCVASDLREGCWGLVKATLVGDDEREAFLAYARRHLDRFADGAGRLAAP